MQQPTFSQPFPNQLQINLFVQRLVLFLIAHLSSNVDIATAPQWVQIVLRAGGHYKLMILFLAFFLNKGSFVQDLLLVMLI